MNYNGRQKDPQENIHNIENWHRFRSLSIEKLSLSDIKRLVQQVRRGQTSKVRNEMFVQENIILVVGLTSPRDNTFAQDI